MHSRCEGDNAVFTPPCQHNFHFFQQKDRFFPKECKNLQFSFSIIFPSTILLLPQYRSSSKIKYLNFQTFHSDASSSTQQALQLFSLFPALLFNFHPSPFGHN